MADRRLLPFSGILPLLLSAGIPLFAQPSMIFKEIHDIPKDIAWPDSAPAGSPWPASAALKGITLTGRYANYGKADTWYLSWASDGSLYSPATDGELYPGLSPNTPTPAYVKLQGQDPLGLSVVSAGLIPGHPEPYGGLYPCANLFYQNIWYYGVYSLDWADAELGCGNWCIQGPFVGFWVSRDQGKTWAPPPTSPAAPLFGESGKNGGKVKIGAPHFVDFGRDQEHSPDGWAYMVAHGASRPDAFVNWIAGDQIYLLRTRPQPDSINKPSSWEFFAGPDAAGRPTWTRDFSRIRPVLEWDGHLGNVSVTYDAPLRKYLMAVCRPKDGKRSVGAFDSFLLESDSLTGPWKCVHYLKDFGTEAYFMNIPSRFLSMDGKSGWLCYSANFAGTPENPPGSKYSLSLHEFRFTATALTSVPDLANPGKGGGEAGFLAAPFSEPRVRIPTRARVAAFYSLGGRRLGAMALPATGREAYRLVRPATVPRSDAVLARFE